MGAMRVTRGAGRTLALSKRQRTYKISKEVCAVHSFGIGICIVIGHERKEWMSETRSPAHNYH